MTVERDVSPWDVLRELNDVRITSTDADRAVLADLREKARVVLAGRDTGAVGERPDIVCTADEMDEALWYLHDHNMGVNAELIMERLAFLSESSYASLISAAEPKHWSGGAVGEREELEPCGHVCGMGREHHDWFESDHEWEGPTDPTIAYMDYIQGVHDAGHTIVNEGGVAPVARTEAEPHE